jgi:hypothetical protein
MVQQLPKPRTPRQWPYTADCPQRYTTNYPRYLARGGQVRLEEDVTGFVAGERNRGDMARFYFFSLAFDQMAKEGVTGDLAELGVYKGNTAALLATYARRLGSVAYLLDTYEGFNQNDIIGIDAGAKPQSFSDTSLEAVRSLVGESNVSYIKGYFPATASQLPADGRYCFVHIDCDLYAPMASALEYFYPRLVPGGFMVVHDYSSLHWNGAEKAVDEFFADKAECPVPVPDGAGSVAVRRARAATGVDNWLLRKRLSLLGPDWVEAGNGRLTELLGNGWSNPEPWGVWGVGDLHELDLVLPVGALTVELEMEVQAALTRSRTEQVVDVSVGNKKLDTWQFTAERNRGIRRVSIPLALTSLTPHGERCVALQFKPASVLSVSELNPTSTDNRSLGVGLLRIRALMG